VSGEVDFVTRMAVVTKLAILRPGLGRTALMKCMYLLQTVKGVPLGYRFQLYAYGPYDSTVLDDLGMAEVWGAVTETVVRYPSGYGYEVRPGLGADGLLGKAAPFLDEHAESVDWVVEQFKGYSAAGMELIGTMVWADREYQREGETRDRNELIKLVLEIKPRFSLEQARSIADHLQRLGVLVSTS